MATTMIITIAILGGLGILFGIGLYMASKKFAVETDPRIEEVTEMLPGANCGACGSPGCSGFAEKLVGNEAELDQCPVSSSDIKATIGKFLGKEISESEPMIAYVHCQKETSEPRFDYDGPNDCSAAILVNNGFTNCAYGCLGFGNCVSACPFDAIYMGENGLPHVLDDKCTGCGNCVAACPRNIIQLHPISKDVHVLCNSNAMGKDVKAACSHGCIGCKICEKKCPQNAIKVTNFLAAIDYDKCVVCGVCVDVCPTGAIGDLSLLRGKKLARERFSANAVEAEKV